MNFIDVLKVTEAMATPLGIVWGIAMVCIPFLFSAAIVTEQAKVIKGERPEYVDIIWTTVWVSLGMILYRFIFTKILAFGESVGMCLMNYGDWAGFMGVLNQKFSEFQEISLLNTGISEILLAISLAIILVAEDIFNVIRFMFLSVLYVIGPIALVSAIYRPIRTFTKNWFLTTFQVSFWVVILRVFQTTLLSFQTTQLIQQNDLSNTIIVCVSIILAIVSIPILTSKLLSIQNLGMLSSALGGGGVFITNKIFGKMPFIQLKDKLKIIREQSLAESSISPNKMVKTFTTIRNIFKSKEPSSQSKSEKRR